MTTTTTPPDNELATGDAATIDPRFRARRIAVRRHEGRRRLRRLGWLGVLAVVAAVVWLLLHSPVFEVRSIDVQGAARTDPAALQTALGIREGDGMMGVDLGAARRALAALPWVDTVSIQRSWPGTVQVRVSERTAAALIGDGSGSWSLVDADGRVLASGLSSPPAKLRRILTGSAIVEPGGTQPGLTSAIFLSTLLTPDLDPWVQGVRTVDGGALELALRDGATVVIGAPVELRAKIIDVATVLSSVKLACLDRIDVRVPRTPVITRRADCA